MPSVRPSRHPALTHAPWKTWEEWNRCRRLLFALDDSFTSQQEALHLLTQWEHTGQSLPFYIAHTAALVRVDLLHRSLLRPPPVVQGEIFCEKVEEDPRGVVETLCLAFAMALVRLVNAVSDHYPVAKRFSGRSSVRQRARAWGIPPELVSLRHQATHEMRLPGLGQLHWCTILALSFLKERFWEVQYRKVWVEIQEAESLKLKEEEEEVKKGGGGRGRGQGREGGNVHLWGVMSDVGYFAWCTPSGTRETSEKGKEVKKEKNEGGGRGTPASESVENFEVEAWGRVSTSRTFSSTRVCLSPFSPFFSKLP